jgi:hypothetical protein
VRDLGAAFLWTTAKDRLASSFSSPKQSPCLPARGYPTRGELPQGRCPLREPLGGRSFSLQIKEIHFSMWSLNRWFRSSKLRWIRCWHFRNGYVKIRYVYQPENQESDDTPETIWAKNLGENLYQLENIPYAEELNLHDVVRCQEKVDDIPSVIEVVRRSGNRTLRVEFRKEIAAEVAVDIILALKEKEIFYEKAGVGLYMFNVEPNKDYETARDFLRSKEKEDILWLYE